MSVAGWTAENQEWRSTILGWRTHDAALHRFADARTVEYLYPDARVTAELAKSGIPLIEAWKRGLTSVNDISKPELLKSAFGLKSIPAESRSGLVIPHFALDGTRSLQYRPNVPYVLETEAEEAQKPRKYDWGRGGGRGISIGYNAARRLADDTAQRLAIVEGTKQAIAADIYAPADVVVVGIQGIWNGQSEGELLEDLKVLAQRLGDITLIPDGDVATKQHVWDGASQLCELLFDATEGRAPKVVVLPANGKDGIDDLLGRLDESARTAFVALTIDAAADLPEPPTGDESDDAAEEQDDQRVSYRLSRVVDASAFVETVYGGAVARDAIELPEGTMSVARFKRGAGSEFVKTTNPDVAQVLGIQANKCATTWTLLKGALGGDGKLAWRVATKFDGMPSALIEWLGENADSLVAAARTLRLPDMKPRTLDELMAVINATFTVADLKGDPAVHATASDLLIHLAKGDTYQAARDMTQLLRPTASKKGARA